jgi:hypothetical protein
MSVGIKAGGMKTCKRKICIQPSPRPNGLSPNFGVTVENGKITNLDVSALFGAPGLSMAVTTNTKGGVTNDLSEFSKSNLAQVIGSQLQQAIDNQNAPDGDYSVYPNNEICFDVITTGNDQDDPSKRNTLITPLNSSSFGFQPVN